MDRATTKKSESHFHETPLKYLEIVSKVIAFVVLLNLLLTSGMISIDAFQALIAQNYSVAIQDGLFVLILLEMFYVIRSFIRYGSINVSLIVNVGIIAAIKEMIFHLEDLSIQTAAAFGIIFVTLGMTYFMEQFYYRKLVKEKEEEPFLA